ncbi:MAG: L-ribulose-5-phosphate 3-epimerase [Erysipelotrichaceae bacterium]|nr:L-ribulose-5-phosphate 3-epimerase [Erysipelotrichaceae bacterium]
MARNRHYLLGMYEKSMPMDLTWEEKLNACKRAGFDWIEISIDETDEKISRLYWSKEQKDELVALMEKTGTPIYTMCFSAQRKYSLGSLGKEKHEKAMEIMEKAIDFAADIGIRIIQLAGYDCYYEEANEETRAEFIKNLKIAAEMAARRGVLMGFETMMDRDFIDTVEKGMTYVNMVNSPYLGMYPDIGNLAGARNDFGYEKTVNEDLRTGAGHILACHLKETKPKTDRSVPWGTGLTDYVSNLEVLKELGVRMFNGEFWNDHPEAWEENLKYSCNFLRERLDKVFED